MAKNSLIEKEKRRSQSATYNAICHPLVVDFILPNHVICAAVLLSTLTHRLTSSFQRLIKFMNSCPSVS